MTQQLKIDQDGNKSVNPSDYLQIINAAGWVLLHEGDHSLVDCKTGLYRGLWFACHPATGQIVRFFAEDAEEDMLTDPDWAAITFMPIITEMSKK